MQKHTAIAAAVGGIALIALTSACKRSPDQPVETSSASAAPAPLAEIPSPSGRPNAVPSNKVPTQVPSAPATAERSDLDITNDVRRIIASDPTLSPEARTVLATTTRGIVQLSGTVATESDKQNVRIAVARVSGVVGVNNLIVVKR